LTVGPIPCPDPPLRGDGFILRRFEDRDETANRAATKDPTTTPWINDYSDGSAADLEQLRADGSMLVLTVADPESDAFLGWVILLMKEWGVGELAYMIAPEARGRGLASRAVRLVGDWAFETLELPRLQLRIDPENATSIRVAQSCGYTFEGVLRSVIEIHGRRVNSGMWSRLPGDP
jgi:RimJ/RimL family protein N-acetyltransferase